MTRRQLITAAAAVASATASRAAQLTAIRLGGPIFLKSKEPVELAKEHRRLGYSAAYCPDVTLQDTAHIREFEQAYARENVVIAEVGAWKNILDPDETVRKQNLAYVTERMALADAIGARTCVDIAGSFNPKVWYGPHKENLSQRFFDLTVENARKIIDSVKPKRSKFSIEMMGWSHPNSAETYLKLIKAIDRTAAFATHIDVCNLVNGPERFYNNADLIEETFRKLGKWIVSCHAKDLAWVPEMNVHIVEVIPGRGEIDYKTYLTALARLPQDAPLMLEHLKTADEYDEGRQYILKQGAATGIRFA